MEQNDLYIVKRDGKKVPFSLDKIKNAIRAAFLSTGSYATEDIVTSILSRVSISQGMSVEEIAKERSLIVSTIFSHLTRFIATGEIQPEALIGSKARFAEVMDYLESHGEYGSMSQLFADADGKFSYDELRVGVAFMEKMETM